MTAEDRRLGPKLRHLRERADMSLGALADTTRGLQAFLAKAEVPAEDVEMLLRIRYRGRQPRTPEDWALLYDFTRRLVR